jgi:uncharacterized protein YhfF
MAVLNAETEALWEKFLQSQTNPSATAKLLCEAFRIGDSQESADEGARLTLSGAKTTTSTLLWEYEELSKPLPIVGSFSILENGRGKPVCIVETTWIEVVPFEKVEADFAVAYAEWGDTLVSWQQRAWTYYSKQCGLLGRTPTLQMPLVCERFRVVHAG